MFIKQMQLCDTEARSRVDLRDFKEINEKCVRQSMLVYDVEVHEKYFNIISRQPQTKKEAVKIGIRMGQTRLGTFAKTHIYTKSRDGSVGISNKIFIEVKKPKGKITIDGTAGRDES